MSNQFVPTITQPILDPREGNRIYAALREQVTAHSILERAYGYYAFLITGSIFCYFGTIVLFYYVQNIFFLTLYAIGAGFFAVQLGGIMHDAAHRAICKTTRNNDIIGQITAGLTVMSYENWMRNHNAHHANPNEEGEDPDLEIPLHVFTQSQFAKRTGLRRLITKYQVLTYYTMRPLTSISTRVNSFRYFIKNYHPRLLWQIGMFIVGALLWFVAPFILFGTGKGLLFVLVSNAFGGFYASNVFAPNHKGMPQVKPGINMSFFEQQVVTARNVSANPLTDFIFLGLNYQIEHHLFPSCPRNKLRYAASFVKKTVETNGLPYITEGVVSSNKIILRHLWNVARTV